MVFWGYYTKPEELLCLKAGMVQKVRKINAKSIYLKVIC
ncbi:MAG: hypothetical protein Rsou_0808 [Candidatus Ruthia sp. Asou_11_S2]|nr:hypothetical protein [Candidatus Ruthia sp. Asou_11_S2]